MLVQCMRCHISKGKHQSGQAHWWVGDTSLGGAGLAITQHQWVDDTSVGLAHQFGGTSLGQG